MKFLVPFVFMIAVGLAGCDPLRRINMLNKSGSDAMILWTIKQDSINSSPFFISNSRDVSFTLTPNAPGNRIKMSFGSGTWHTKQLKNLIDDLDSLVISSKAGSHSYTTEKEIKNFLLPRRKGIDKSKIDILITE